MSTKHFGGMVVSVTPIVRLLSLNTYPMIHRSVLSVSNLPSERDMGGSVELWVTQYINLKLGSCARGFILTMMLLSVSILCTVEATLHTFRWLDD